MDKKEDISQKKREIVKKEISKREKNTNVRNKIRDTEKKNKEIQNKNIKSDVVKRFEYNRPNYSVKESVSNNDKGNKRDKNITAVEGEKKESNNKKERNIKKESNINVDKETQRERKAKRDINVALKKDRNSNKNTNTEKSNVTNIKDIQRQALENEKKHKKEEKISKIRQRLELLKTTKAKVYITFFGIMIAFFIYISLTIVDNVIVDEGKHYTKNEVKNMVIKSVFDYNSVYLFLKNRYNEQEPIPFVEYIDVIWVDKNTIKLKVYDKNIIGCTNFMNEYVYFDKDGYVVETSSKKEDEIPYITGIDFEELTLNSKIKVADEDIFELILNVTQQISKYELQIDEINFDKNYNLTLYSGGVTILLGKQKTYDEQLAKLKSTLEEANKEKLSGVLHMEKYKEGQDRIIFDKNS